MADNKKTAARSVRGVGLDEKKPALKSRFFECGRRERITCIFDAALRAVAKATLSRFARLKPPSEVLILINFGGKKTCFKSRLFECGRRERIRTSDPLVPNQLRYQAALLAESERMLLPLVQSVNAFF